MKTAVEWLFEQLCSEKLSWNKDSNGKLFFDNITSDILQQAKEMEKQQINKCYSEEEVIDLLQKMNDWPTICEGRSDIEEWFEQFKKK